MTPEQEKLLVQFHKMPTQCQWYMQGHFPIVCGVEGHSDPEPTAIKYLIESGFVIKGECGLTKKTHYLISDAGREIQEMLQHQFKQR